MTTTPFSNSSNSLRSVQRINRSFAGYVLSLDKQAVSAATGSAEATQIGRHIGRAGRRGLVGRRPMLRAMQGKRRR